MNNTLIAFTMTLIAGLSTLLGTIFVFKKKNSQNLVKNSLAFAAGVMLCVSIIDLIPEAIELLNTENTKNKSFIILSIFIIIGLSLSALIDKLVPENNKVSDKKLYKVGIFSMLAIIAHNIPEGIATFLSSETNLTLGISLTIAIALHNIPEGISISVPIYNATNSKSRAVGYTLISALAEPLGAVLAFLILKPIITNTIMGTTLAIIAGIMTHISLLQLLPTSLKYKEKIKTVLFFIIGIIFMAISHLLMN